MDKGELLISVLIGYTITGLISWFVTSKKEEHCLKECKRLSRTSQVWMPKLCFGEKFINLGGLLLGLIQLLGVPIFILTWAIKDNGARIVALGGITLFWVILYMILKKASKYPYPPSLFAIVNDELIVWFRKAQSV